MDLTLNDLQGLICHKTQPTNYIQSRKIIKIDSTIAQSMSTRLGLFYAERLWNCVHCTFIFTFLCFSRGGVSPNIKDF